MNWTGGLILSLGTPKDRVRCCASIRGGMKIRFDVGDDIKECGMATSCFPSFPCIFEHWTFESGMICWEISSCRWYFKLISCAKKCRRVSIWSSFKFSFFILLVSLCLFSEMHIIRLLIWNTFNSVLTYVRIKNLEWLRHQPRRTEWDRLVNKIVFSLLEVCQQSEIKCRRFKVS